jgi:thiamine biosynthesis lipoprotein
VVAGSLLQLEVPDRPGEIFAELRVWKGGVATSAPTYRVFEREGRRYSHVLDPRSGRPSDGVASATVFGPDAARADAFATACLVLGDEAKRILEDRPELEGILVTPDGQFWKSSGLEVRWLLDGSEPRFVEGNDDQ